MSLVNRLLVTLLCLVSLTLSSSLLDDDHCNASLAKLGGTYRDGDGSTLHFNLCAPLEATCGYKDCEDETNCCMACERWRIQEPGDQSSACLGTRLSSIKPRDGGLIVFVDGGDSVTSNGKLYPRTMTYNITCSDSFEIKHFTKASGTVGPFNYVLDLDAPCPKSNTVKWDIINMSQSAYFSEWLYFTIGRDLSSTGNFVTASGRHTPFTLTETHTVGKTIFGEGQILLPSGPRFRFVSSPASPIAVISMQFPNATLTATNGASWTPH